MAQCDQCGSTILFGGITQGDYRFCKPECQQGAYLLQSAERIPEEVISQQVAGVHQGKCPKCGGPGPVDVHFFHSVWSALVMTRWSSKSMVCCQSCGTKSKLGGAASSMVLGWWGFPWGLIMTPIQISRNLLGIFSSPDPLTPSPQLVKLVKVDLAQQLPHPAPGPKQSA